MYTRPPLHLAARRGASHLEIINLLLQYGAQPDIETDYFGTALDGALDGEDPIPVIQVLEKNRAILGADQRRRQALLDMVRGQNYHSLAARSNVTNLSGFH